MILLQTGTAEEPDFEISRYPVRCGSTVFAIGDLDDDGALDVAAGGPDGTRVTIRRGDGAGGFADVVQIPMIAAPDQLHIADFTGNGAADILILNLEGDSLNYAFSIP